jgi:predicted flavoprotein YhiN
MDMDGSDDEQTPLSERVARRVKKARSKRRVKKKAKQLKRKRKIRRFKQKRPVATETVESAASTARSLAASARDAVPDPDGSGEPFALDDSANGGDALDELDTVNMDMDSVDPVNPPSGSSGSVDPVPDATADEIYDASGSIDPLEDN